jgi:CO/xanthine dehydrogenase Mo-binding subunit
MIRLANVGVVRVEKAEIKRVGTPTLRVDSLIKVTGRAIFTRDMSLPGMLYAAIKRCSLPHAKVLRIDSSQAKSLPTVEAVITADDFKERVPGIDTPPLAKEVFYPNQAVAALAARDRLWAAAAASKILVEYEELPAVFDAEAAISTTSPAFVVHDGEKCERPNVGRHIVYERGNPRQAFVDAHKVVKRRYTTAAETHFQLEPLCFLVRPDADGGLTVWGTSSGAHKLQAELAAYLDMDPSLIRAKVPFLGGWFGSKEENHVAAICAKLALKTRRPVKLELTREETITATAVRHPATFYVADALTKEGLILGRELTAIYNGGAYGSLGNDVLQNALHSAVSVYKTPNLKIELYRVYTNRVPGGMKRAPFSTQITWAIECQADEDAKAVGLSPLDFRRLNVLRQGDINPLGEVMKSISHERCLSEVEAALSREDARVSQVAQELKRRGWIRGRGFALGTKSSHLKWPAQAMVRVRENGKIEVWADVTENGQGTFTGLSQIVANEFDVPIDSVILSSMLNFPDSATTGIATGASASRQTVLLGKALIEACSDAKSRIAKEAAKMLDARINEIVVKGGEAYVKSYPERRITISELFKKTKFFSTEYSYLLGEGFVGYGASVPGAEQNKKLFVEQSNGVPFYTNVAQGVDLSVNPWTGQIMVHRVVAAMDVGFAINPELVKGQILGSVATALSAVLGEELVFSQGSIINPSLMDYKILSSLDTPVIEPIIIESPYENGPYGAKNAGEASTVATAPAVRNALVDALGVFIRDTPITPERVVAALDESREKRVSER